MTLTELKQALEQHDIYMPLPWAGYDGSFCCNSCVSYHLEEDGEFERHEGCVWINVQTIENQKDNSPYEIYLNFSGKCTDAETVKVGKGVCQVLRQAEVPHVWDGTAARSIKLVISPGRDCLDWLEKNDQDQEFNDY